MSIEIPECEDIEWQQNMLRRLHIKLENAKLYEMDEAESVIDEAIEIVDALRQYSGY